MVLNQVTFTGQLDITHGTGFSKMNDNFYTADGAFKMRGDWKIQCGLLKRKFPQLTNEDLAFEPGREKELLRRLEKKLNLKRTEVIEIIKYVQPAKHVLTVSPHASQSNT